MPSEPCLTPWLMIAWSPQIRTSVNALLCASKEFSWIRHCIITMVLLAGVNILVIFVPTIRDIFGFIGKSGNRILKGEAPSVVLGGGVAVELNCYKIPPKSDRSIFPYPGASAAAMLIFILPSAFYIKLVKKESMKSMQKIGVRKQCWSNKGVV